MTATQSPSWVGWPAIGASGLDKIVADKLNNIESSEWNYPKSGPQVGDRESDGRRQSGLTGFNCLVM